MERRLPGCISSSRLPMPPDALSFPDPDAAPHVLVIDDHRDAAEMTATLLQLHGCHTTVAHDGTSGLAAASRVAPDFVLLDLDLPGALHGTDVAQRLRAGHAGRRPMVIGMTGNEANYRGARDCFDHALTKPMDLTALLALLRAAWRLRRAGAPQT